MGWWLCLWLSASPALCSCVSFKLDRIAGFRMKVDDDETGNDGFAFGYWQASYYVHVHGMTYDSIRFNDNNFYALPLHLLCPC
ncbi:hypothetical protein HBI56_189740 [Parastagonospora nodorum]|uniref:Uncharacterized protein n=1 Tax=Phaeosphaeria nodorum (strain SN15 / ATCC MYA-4574 / FGSC 10173) TaxID=321614 RepID=A0A7U2I687_PHANO|nr:hypothetical protein HBH56_144720 [Parastagonospora nodorum]QRD01387.1 hypothetical protein JI435_120580 [Parastagonospora nodorum SN15]KAH3927793.1 hypothetical protein HBH54_149910 [Parastagonospora nodorum]KAH3947856.1 hypothetical protein HBH53_109950 [Parastagonospora nodorum]KAH3960166.1 hypothetical protein HBH51_193770 [Parastagonospora nodorum]